MYNCISPNIKYNTCRDRLNLPYSSNTTFKKPHYVICLNFIKTNKLCQLYLNKYPKKYLDINNKSNLPILLTLSYLLITCLIQSSLGPIISKSLKSLSSLSPLEHHLLQPLL